MSDSTEPAYRPIGDYGLIGDCRSAALISSTGSIDWLCWPRFDSPSIFGALLDWRRGGRFKIAPVEPFTTTRRYVGDAAVLETTFQTANGVVRLSDLMPVASEAEKARALWPDHELLRRVECLGGTVEIEVRFDPRPDYGQVVPRLIDGDAIVQGGGPTRLASARAAAPSSPAQGVRQDVVAINVDDSAWDPLLRGGKNIHHLAIYSAIQERLSWHAVRCT